MNMPLRVQDAHRPPPIDLDRSGEAAGRFLSPTLAFHPALAPSERAEVLHAERLGQRANDLVARDPFAFRAAASLAFGDKADPQSLGTLVELARADRLCRCRPCASSTPARSGPARSAPTPPRAARAGRD